MESPLTFYNFGRLLKIKRSKMVRPMEIRLLNLNWMPAQVVFLRHIVSTFVEVGLYLASFKWFHL